MPKPRSVLVTGGGGFIGVPVVTGFLDAGLRVIVVDNFGVGRKEALAHLRERDLRVQHADIRDFARVNEVIADARPWAVVHLAALHFIPYCNAHPRETYEVNVLGLQNVLAASTDVEVARFIFASTADVYPPRLEPHQEYEEMRPTGPYGASKAMGEWLVQIEQEKVPSRITQVARLFNAYGPCETNPHLLPSILAQLRVSDTLLLGNLETRRDYTFVGDIASILCRLTLETSEGGTYNVGAGNARTAQEMVDRVARLTGRELAVEVDPSRVRASDRPHLEADHSRLAGTLGDLRFTDIDAGLRATLVVEGLLPSVTPVTGEGLGAAVE